MEIRTRTCRIFVLVRSLDFIGNVLGVEAIEYIVKYCSGFCVQNEWLGTREDAGTKWALSLSFRAAEDGLRRI